MNFRLEALAGNRLPDAVEVIEERPVQKTRIRPARILPRNIGAHAEMFGEQDVGSKVRERSAQTRRGEWGTRSEGIDLLMAAAVNGSSNTVINTGALRERNLRGKKKPARYKNRILN